MLPRFHFQSSWIGAIAGATSSSPSARTVRAVKS
jgi:hypothetical protein